MLSFPAKKPDRVPPAKALPPPSISGRWDGREYVPVVDLDRWLTKVGDDIHKRDTMRAARK